MSDQEDAPRPAEGTENAPPPRKRTGRPLKFTPEARDKALEAIRGGAFFSAAAPYAGVSRRVLDRWLEQGRKSKSGPLHEFWRAAEEALAQAELRATLVVARAITGDPGDAATGRPAKPAGHIDLVRAAKVALAYLERRFSRRWGKHTQTTLKGEGPGGTLPYTGKLEISVVPGRRVDNDGRVLGEDGQPLALALRPAPEAPFEAEVVALPAPASEAPAPGPAPEPPENETAAWSRTGKAHAPFHEPKPAPSVEPQPGTPGPPRWDD